jgi:hypothetical protein
LTSREASESIAAMQAGSNEAPNQNDLTREIASKFVLKSDIIAKT